MATKTFEIYGTDLTLTAQRELCNMLGIDDISEANYDVFPITSVDFDVDGSED